MSHPSNVLCITASTEDQIDSDRVELLVTIRGSSLFTGKSALTNAKEVRALVEALAALGLNESAIRLENVRGHVSSGLLGKSSEATYRLRIACDRLDALPDVLGAVTSAKNAVLEQLVWGYPETVALQAAQLATCVAHAYEKAHAVATALGARVVGVQKLEEERLDDGSRRHSVGYEGSKGFERRSVPVDLGFDLTHQKRTGVKVTVEFRIEGFAPPTH